MKNIKAAGLVLTAMLLSGCSTQGGMFAPAPTPTPTPVPAEDQGEPESMVLDLASGKKLTPTPTITFEDFGTDEYPTDADPDAPVEPEETIVTEDLPVTPPETEGVYDISELSAKTYSETELSEIAAFYSNTVFAGDSVMLGLRNFCTRSAPWRITSADDTRWR